LYTTIAAFLLWEVLLLAGLLGGGEALAEWLMTVGVLGTLVGEVLYGAATLQARVLPRWCGILFIILCPVRSFLFSFGGLFKHMGWSSLDSTGVRPLVDQGRGSRAADACEVDSLLPPSLSDFLGRALAFWANGTF
jgi:hypothetical protein